MKVDHIIAQSSGIYCIINLVNNKQYIGSSKLLRKRLLQHKRDLRRNNHCNKKLQYSWNKYGEDSFYCIVLEYCNNLIEAEQFYIDNLKPELNISKIVGQYNPKQSNSIDIVYKYSLDGKYLHKYDDIIDAARENNIALSSIYRCLNNTYKKAGDFIYSTEKVDNMKPYKKRKNNSYLNRKVVVSDYTSLEKVYEFNSLKECAKYFKVHPPTISYAIKVKQKFKKKYLIYKQTEATLDSDI